MGFIFTTDEPSDELTAAQNIVSQLKELNQFKKDDDFECIILIEPNLGNASVKEPDIIMICKFEKPMSFSFQPPLEHSFNDKEQDKIIHSKITAVKLENFIAVVEVKGQTANFTKFNENNALEVYYKKKNRWENATGQNNKQIYYIKNYLSRNREDTPKVAGFVYLHNVKKSQFKNHHKKDFPINLRCHDHGAGFIESIAHQIIQFRSTSYLQKYAPAVVGSCYKNQGIDYYLKLDWRQSNPRPSMFDMKRMNAIAKKVEPWHFEDLSERMIEYSGLGGTGKTIKLLQIAYQTYKEEQKDVLFLTYNWALIIGLRLTMTHMSIPHISSGGGIFVESCSRFFWNILKNLGFISNEDRDEIDRNRSAYDEIYKEALTDCVKQLQTLNDEEVGELLRQSSDHEFQVFSEIVLVDEGQDWMPEEQFILEKVFKTKNILVAHGKGQETRGMPTVWGKHLKVSRKREEDCDKRIHILTKALRMRGNLGTFVKTFADLTLTDEMYKRLEPNPEALEGEVIIIEGDYFKESDLRKELQNKRESEAGDVYPLDLLHIVPPGMKVSDFNHGLDESLIWDGIGRESRKEMPVSERQVRWVNYRSCRGLEGWITFNHYLDDYWEYEFNTQKIDIAQGSLFENATEEQKKNEAFRWVLIALTRPIDSTVITIRDKNSELGKVLQEIHERHSSFIRWID